MAVFTVHGQVGLPAKSGVSRDEVINTFTFSTDDTSAASLAAFVDTLVQDFYNVQVGGGNPIANHLGQELSRATGAAHTKWYDITTHLAGGAAGPPVLETFWTLGADNGADPLPREVAVACSFHGSYATIPEFGPGTRPRARHRGRIFIGPLTESALANPAAPNFEPMVNSNLLNDIASSAEELIGAGAGSWVVWSRKNAAVYPVVGGWVDNAFDTIRGRGNDMTSRTDFGSLV